MKDRTRAARRTVVGKTPAQRKRVNANQWYRIENLVDRPSTAAIYIYDVIGCTCWWDDECRCVTAMNLVDELASLRVDNLHIHINSPGGEVDDGIAIYNTLRNHQARKTTFIDSLAASAASVIALAADEVVIAETGQLMIHEASTIAIGDAEDMRRCADLLDRYSNTVAGVYSRKSGMSVEECRDLMRAETWFTGAEAVTAGLADRTDEEPDEQGDDMEERMTARHNLSLFAFRYAGREAAPAPQLTNHAEPVAPEPATEPTAEPDPVVAPDAAAAPEPEATVDPPAEPVVPDPVGAAEDVTPADGAPVVPATSGSTEAETGQPVPAADVDTAAGQPVPEAAEPSVDTPAVPEPAAATTDADAWAQAMSPLISATPAPSTWDDVFANLTKP